MRACARAGVHVGKVLLEVGGPGERLAGDGTHPAVRGPLAAAAGHGAAPADVAEVPDAPIKVKPYIQEAGVCTLLHSSRHLRCTPRAACRCLVVLLDAQTDAQGALLTAGAHVMPCCP